MLRNDFVLEEVFQAMAETTQPQKNGGTQGPSAAIAAARERLAEKGAAAPTRTESIVRLSDDDRELLTAVLDEIQQLRRDLGFRQDAIPVETLPSPSDSDATSATESLLVTDAEASLERDNTLSDPAAADDLVAPTDLPQEPTESP